MPEKPPSENVKWARRIIAGAKITDLQEAIDRAKALKGENRFDLARSVLAAAPVQPGDPFYVLVQQQIALCTYKDEDIPMPHRFYAALDVLRTKCALDTTLDTETLGLAGAVYKRLWEFIGQRETLERSLACYHKAYKQKPNDQGYVAINTAYILDVLASKENATVEGIPPNVPSQRFAEADRIRAEIVSSLKAVALQNADWWLCATVAEAALGIGEFATVVECLKLGLTARPDAWERDSTIRQLANVARIQSGRRGERYRVAAEAALMEGLSITPQVIRSIALGKVGLALSGGGFRASLFHIGMLAKLAELDVLRHVEVLSCVSGGSIVGAHYYLELKRDLEAKGELTQQEYIEIVQRVEREFLIGVQSNVRTRVASSVFASIRMALQPGYTRTSRAGELYEQQLYKRIDGVSRRSLPSLLITPKGTQSFNPRTDNWARESKVPILVLNSTTINTGHNWQFTATWMGESPQAINGAIDAIPRLRRMYIDGRDDIPENFRDFPLGQAVGASAAVPGVFDPIVLQNVYPNRTVRLSDGGVHDNQGLASLLEESCNVLLVSDASGQMQDATNPPGGILSVAGRTNTILQARVREAQFDQLQTLQRSGGIDGAMFIHLTKELEADAISFDGAHDTVDVIRELPSLTTYLVDRRIQKQLAEVRTDLDSFSDAEAYALMMSGYAMTEHALLVEKCAPTLPINSTLAQWRFLRVQNALTNPKSADNARMRRLLAASKQLAGRVWLQVRALQILAGAAAAAAVVWLVLNHEAVGRFLTTAARASVPAPTYGKVAELVGVIALAVGIRYAADKILHLQKRIGELLLGLTLATVGFVAAWLHLTIFDQIYLWYGRWDEPKQPAPPPAFAPPGTPRLPIKAPSPSGVQPSYRIPMMRRILNLFSSGA